MVEVDTDFPMRLVLCTEAEMLLIQNKEDMKKVQVNKHILYFELSSKPSVEILGVKVSMLKQHDFETIFTYNDVMNIQYDIGKGFGST